MDKQDKNVEFPLLGLHNSGRYPTFLQKLKMNGLIEHNQYTFDFKKKKITFGKIETNERTLKIKDITNGHFQFYVEKISFFGKVLSKTKINCILDSGNTLIAIPGTFKNDIVDILKK